MRIEGDDPPRGSIIDCGPCGVVPAEIYLSGTRSRLTTVFWGTAPSGLVVKWQHPESGNHLWTPVMDRREMKIFIPA